MDLELKTMHNGTWLQFYYRDLIFHLQTQMLSESQMELSLRWNFFHLPYMKPSLENQWFMILAPLTPSPQTAIGLEVPPHV